MDLDKDSLLSKAKELLSEELVDLTYTLLAQPLKIEDINGSNIVLLLPSTSQKMLLLSSYLENFKNVFDYLTNLNCTFKVLTPEELDDYRNKKNTEKKVDTDIKLNNNLNPNYTFSSFVVGSNNDIATATAKAIAENPSGEYNPLFIYGGPGLGKTHLMHAIANEIAKIHPDKKILYVSSEKFLIELVNSIKNRNSDTEEFRQKYRNVDIFIMDDIQFLSAKESAQQELFNTFNDLYSKGKQIVFSADKPPKNIPVIEERLKSRFNQGLIVDISAPDFETRLAILKVKAEERNMIISDTVLSLIAEKIETNIRYLEGALNNIMVTANLTKMPISLEMAEKAINKICLESENIITPDVILDVVSNYFNVEKRDLLSTKKSQEIVFPRQIAMYLCRNELNMQYKKIGEIFGKKDHTTIMHAETKIRKSISTDKNTKLILDSVDNILKNFNQQ